MAIWCELFFWALRPSCTARDHVVPETTRALQKFPYMVTWRYSIRQWEQGKAPLWLVLVLSMRPCPFPSAPYLGSCRPISRFSPSRDAPIFSFSCLDGPSDQVSVDKYGKTLFRALLETPIHRPMLSAGFLLAPEPPLFRPLWLVALGLWFAWEQLTDTPMINTEPNADGKRGLVYFCTLLCSFSLLFTVCLFFVCSHSHVYRKLCVYFDIHPVIGIQIVSFVTHHPVISMSVPPIINPIGHRIDNRHVCVAAVAGGALWHLGKPHQQPQERQNQPGEKAACLQKGEKGWPVFWCLILPSFFDNAIEY